MAVAALLFAAPRHAHASVETAAKAYAAGRFEDAAKDYEAERARAPRDARLAFNAGDAAYRAGHYEAADAAFDRAMARGRSQAPGAGALQPEGNTRYRLGEAQQDPSAPAQAIEQWEGGAQGLRLARSPSIRPTPTLRFNRDFVAAEARGARAASRRRSPAGAEEQRQGRQERG